MQQWTGSKLGKEYIKAVYCQPAYLTYMQSTSCKMLDRMKHNLEARLSGEISATLDMEITPPLWQKGNRNLMKVKEESENVGLKVSIQKTKIMASAWEMMGKQWRQCQTLFLGAPKSLQMVTAAMKLKDA